MSAVAQPLRALRAVAAVTQVTPATAFAIRFATAVSASIWIGHAPGLVTSDSQWILITVLMVAQAQTGGSRLKGLLRLLGTLAAFPTAILLFGLFSQDPPLLLAGLFVVEALGAYGFSGSKHQYAWFVWAFTTAIVLGDALAGSGPVETVAFERVSMVSIGLLIVFTVDSLFWPTRSEPSLRSSLAARARELSTALRQVVSSSAADDGATLRASPLSAQLGMLAAVRAEVGVSDAHVTALGEIALLLESLASRGRSLLGEPLLDPESTPPGFVAAREEFGRALELALSDAANALHDDRQPAELLSELNRTLPILDAERQSLLESTGESVTFASRATVCSDLVALLRTLEELLRELQSDSSTDSATAPRSTPPQRVAAHRFATDPFRVQLALRSGIAVCAAFVIPMALGWEVNTMVAPIAFMIAALPSRGGVTQTLGVLGGILLVAWLLADLTLVFGTPLLGRIPLALLYPAAVGGAFAWIASSRPKLASLPSIGGLIAILPVMSGTAAPTDVYGSYNTMCYVAMGLTTGTLATRLLWPATAASLFRKRVAAKIELLLAAFQARDAGPASEERRRRTVEFLYANARESLMLAPLHGQASHEATENALDDERRASLLSLVEDLADSVLGAHRAVRTANIEALASADDSVVALRERLLRLDQALLASIRATADTLRGEPVNPSSALSEAREAVPTFLRERQEETRSVPLLDPAERAEFLVQLDARRLLVRRQLALECWVTEWCQAIRGLPFRA